MKTANKILIVLSPEDMAQLTSNVIETIADMSEYKVHKPFGTTDLWNIQRKKKAVSIRSFRM